MRTVDDLTNEVTIVCRHRQKLSVWACAPHELDAFMDPLVWRDPDRFSMYFEPLKPAWGIGPKGCVLLDLQTSQHRFYTLGISHVLGTLRVPSRSTRLANPAQEKALNSFLETPSAWADAALIVERKHWFKPKETYTTILNEILLPPKNIDDILTNTPNTIRSSVGKVSIKGGWYQPSYIQQGLSFEEITPVVLIGLLGILKEKDFPAPYWEHMDDTMRAVGLDLAALAQTLAMASSAPLSLYSPSVSAELSRKYTQLKSKWRYRVSK